MKLLKLRGSDGEHEVEIRNDAILVDGAPVEPPHKAFAVADGTTRWVFLAGEVYTFEVIQAGRRRGGTHHASLAAPMPATVVRVNASPGSTVKQGDTLVVLEAMKMELPIRAGQDGVVSAVNCSVGQLVQPGEPLIEID